MSNLAKSQMTGMKPHSAGGSAGIVRSKARGPIKAVVDLSEALNNAVEDEVLNAIADERAAGPFVKVSLDDL